LKSTKGVKAFMQATLADLKCLRAAQNEKTKHYSIHFYDKGTFADEDEDTEEYIDYPVFLREDTSDENIGIIDWNWRYLLPLEVVVAENQHISNNEIVAGILWEITYFAPTHKRYLRKMREFKKEAETLNVTDKH
jgi:predicted transglutaminase-like protease